MSRFYVSLFCMIKSQAQFVRCLRHSPCTDHFTILDAERCRAEDSDCLDAATFCAKSSRKTANPDDCLQIPLHISERAMDSHLTAFTPWTPLSSLNANSNDYRLLADFS